MILRGMKQIVRGVLILVAGCLLIARDGQSQTTYMLRPSSQGPWIQNYYPLYEALAQRDLAAVKRLTPRGEGINAFGEAGATPLSWFMTLYANTPEELQILEHLLESGADPNRLDASVEAGVPPRTGVHLYAARRASGEAVRLLLEHGMTFDTHEKQEAFVEAAAAGNLDFLRAVHAAGLLTQDHLETLPLLSVAALQGEYLTTGYLLKLGADPNGVRLDGFLPLHWAVLRDRPGVVRLLLEAGADPEAHTAYAANPDLDGLTARGLVDVLRRQQEEPDPAYLKEVEAALVAGSDAP